MWPAGRNFKKQQPGQAIEARTLNRPADYLSAESRRKVGTNLAAMMAAGTVLERVVQDRTLQVRITGGGANGIYAWQAVYRNPVSPNNAVDLPTQLSGTLQSDPAYEVNKNDKIKAGTVVDIRREWGSQAWTFQYDQCPQQQQQN